MPDLKEIHQRIREQKKEKKKVSDSLRDVLAQSKSYQDVCEQLKELKAKKAKIEREIRQDFTNELEQAERITESLKTDQQMLTDLALTKFMKGETIEIVDENEVKYEPVFKITFKKSS